VRRPPDYHAVIFTENGLVGVHYPDLERAEVYVREWERRAGLGVTYWGYRVHGGVVAHPDGEYSAAWGDTAYRAVPRFRIATGQRGRKGLQTSCIRCGERLREGAAYYNFHGKVCLECAAVDPDVTNLEHPLNHRWRDIQPQPRRST
jgi:hypothetical protein